MKRKMVSQRFGLSASFLLFACTLFLLGAKAEKLGEAWFFNPKKAVSIEAETLEITEETGAILFSGKVKITQGALVIHAEKLRLAANASGKIQSLEASGQVRLSRKKWRAKAARLRYDAESGRISLLGRPVVTKGKTRIAGERIEVDPSTGKIEVKNAKATLSPEGVLPKPEKEKGK